MRRSGRIAIRRLRAAAARPVGRRIGVATAQQMEHNEGASAVEADVTIEPTGIAERAHQHVPQGEVGVVVAVHATPVMHAMRLRPLDQHAKPLRRAHVGVLEQAVERADITDDCASQRVEPEVKNTMLRERHRRIVGQLRAGFAASAAIMANQVAGIIKATMSSAVMDGSFVLS